MNRLTKLSLAALGGVTVLTLANAADAATGSSTFYASINDVRRYCERVDEPFWKLKRKYGCGDQIVCASGECEMHRKPPPPPRRRLPPTFVGEPGEGRGGNGSVHGSGDSKGGGNMGGGASSSGRGAAGGPN